MTATYRIAGLRFLYRRMAHALIRRDTRMIDDPQRAQAAPLALGFLLAVIMAIGVVVWSLFSSAALVRNARIVVDRDTGAMYVRIGPRLDPVTNLPSARLIVGAPANPVKASGAEIAKYPHGSLVGIVGASIDIRDNTDPSSIWSVCDTASSSTVALVSGLPTTAKPPVRTTLISGQLTKSSGATRLSNNQARLVSYDQQTWLIYTRPDGEVVRSSVDLTNVVTSDALGLRASDPIVPISRGLFNAIPAEPPLVAPPIVDVGTPPNFALNGPFLVGAILDVHETSGITKYYVVLSDGVQEVGWVAATMIRAANMQVGAPPVGIGPDELASLPKSNQLEVSFYPATRVELVSGTQQPVTCWSWSHVGDNSTARTEIIFGRSLPLSDKQSEALLQLVSVATSKGTTANRVYLPTNGGRFVQTARTAADSKDRQSYFWIADNGVRFELDTTDPNAGDTTLAALNLHHPVSVPWAVISELPAGPRLSQREAQVRHDGVTADRVVAGIDNKEMK